MPVELQKHLLQLLKEEISYLSNDEISIDDTPENREYLQDVFAYNGKLIVSVSDMLSRWLKELE